MTTAYNRFTQPDPPTTMKLPVILLGLVFATCQAAIAQDFSVGKIRVSQPYARATAPGQQSAAVYLTLENRAASADRLTAISTPVAASAEMHTMSMRGTMMTMREVKQIALPPGAKITMAPGDGYHIMLSGLQQPLKVGKPFPLVLTFLRAGTIATTVTVQPLTTTQ